MRVVAIVQARLGSTRLPGKVLMPIAGEPMLSHVVRRAKQIKSVDEVIVATDGDSFMGLLQWAMATQTNLYNGPDEPLARYVEVAGSRNLAEDDYIVRITGDCPGLDPVVSNAVVRLAVDNNLFYAANVMYWPDGLDTEVFTVGTLRGAAEEVYARGMDPAGQRYYGEHVTPWIRQEAGRYELIDLAELRGGPGRGYKWSVDDEFDLEYLRELYAALGRDWGYTEALAADPGAVCSLCSQGVPYPKRSLTSISGVPTHTVDDIHEVTVSGGVAYEPCEAWQMVKRGHVAHGPAFSPRLSPARPDSTP